MKNQRVIEKIEEALRIIEPNRLYTYIGLNDEDVNYHFYSLSVMSEFLENQIKKHKYVKGLVKVRHSDVYTVIADEDKIEVGKLNHLLKRTAKKTVKLK
jgi:hypothetical protein